MAPKYELPRGDYTFYYLELALEMKFTRKLNYLKESLAKTSGSIKYDWSGTEVIRSTEEFEEWREAMGYQRNNDFRRKDYLGKREVLDTFKGGEMEEEDLVKKAKKVIVSKNEVGRTWYSPEAWQYGGLRLKEEVKEEEETFELVREDGEGPSAKRARMAGH